MVNIKKEAMEKETLFDKFFRDSDGNIVIAQPPNPPIILLGLFHSQDKQCDREQNSCQGS